MNVSARRRRQGRLRTKDCSVKATAGFITNRVRNKQILTKAEKDIADYTDWTPKKDMDNTGRQDDFMKNLHTARSRPQQPELQEVPKIESRRKSPKTLSPWLRIAFLHPWRRDVKSVGF
jgi:hypothetical protein